MKTMMIIAGALVAATPAVAQTAPVTTDGAYAGGFVGYSATSPHYREPTAPAYNRNPSLEGISGGVFVGYNRSMGTIKTGVEADWGLVDNNGGRDENNDFNDYTRFTTKWNGHLRAKIGAEIQGATVFAAGGLAVTRIIADDTSAGWDSFAHTYTGLTVGAGAEKSIGGNAFVRAEYLHDMYGKTKGEITEADGSSYDVTMTPNTDAVRLGFGIRF